MKGLLIIVHVLCTYTIFAQITFTSIPQDKQLVGRDLVTNKGTVLFEGEVDSSLSPYDIIRVTTYRNGVHFDIVEQALDYIGQTATFSLSVEIKAELANYRFEVSGIEGTTESLEKVIEDVVAGDAYLITGQSNAEAKMRSGSAAQEESEFIRVYASGIPIEANLVNNDNWYLGQGDGSRFSDGNTGQWGLSLARQIVDKHQVPVAIFNGAHGGKELSFFQAPMDYQTNLSSNYGRLFYRIKKAGLQENIRSVFWSQGERNALPSIASTKEEYMGQFLSLKNAWYNDYPNIEHIYLFQTRNGCGRPIENVMRIKEAQRQLAFDDKRIHCIPTANLQQFSDNCHFDYEDGYQEFGKRLFDLVDRDIYAADSNSDLEAPMIIDAYLLDPLTLAVETNARTLMLNGPISDFEIENNSNTEITEVIVSENKIIISLSNAIEEGATISYFAQEEGEEGTFIENDRGIELLCFHQYPIKTTISSNPKNAATRINTYPNPASTKMKILGLEKMNGSVRIELQTLAGEIIVFDKESSSTEIDVSSFSSGMYILRAYHENGVSVQRVSIKR